MLVFREPVMELARPRGRPRLPVRQAGVEKVMAMVELRDHMRGVTAKRALAAERAEEWQGFRTALNAFFLFCLLAGFMVLFMWAGVNG